MRLKEYLNKPNIPSRIEIWKENELAGKLELPDDASKEMYIKDYGDELINSIYHHGNEMVKVYLMPKHVKYEYVRRT